MPGGPTLGATALGLLSAAAWGGGDFAGGMAVRRASPFVTVALVHGLSLLMLLALLYWLGTPLPSARGKMLGILCGLVAGLSVALFYEALSLGKMGLSAAIAGVLSAAIPVAFSFFTEGLPRPIQIVGFLLAGVAIWLVASAPGGGTHPRGLGLATLAGIGFGVYFILLKLAGREGVVWALTFARIGSFALAATVVAFQWAMRQRASVAAPALPQLSGPPEPSNSKSGSLLAPAFVGLVVATCVLDTGGNWFYTLATRAGRLDVAAVLSSLYPAGTMLLAAWLLKERTTRVQTLGMVLALGAVILIAL
ncbi:MAG TPA: DMT family transporter [Acidisarcina sp.]|nr:DMT family transporter [Acidisarcina sp.]